MRIFVSAVVGFSIVSAAWLFGGTNTEYQVAITAFIALTAGITVPWMWMSSTISPIPSLAWVMVMGILAAAWQLFPVGETGQRFWSPTAVELRNELLGDVPGDLKSDRTPISLYPASGRRDLSLLILYATVFLLVGHGLARRGGQRAFYALIVTHGAALALFGIAQQLTFNGKLYWTVDMTQGGEPFASFVNRNHAAAHLNLCLAAALVLLIWDFRSSGRHLSDDDAHRRWMPPPENWQEQIRLWVLEGLTKLTGARILLTTAILLMLTGVLCSLSRGGIVSLLGAAMVCAAVVSDRSSRKWLLVGSAAALLMGMTAVTWMGRDELLRERFSAFNTRWLDAARGRWDHWLESAHMIPDFARAGSGLGTYRYLYPLYQQAPRRGWYYHAENHYLETAVELGLPGLLLLLIAIGLAARSAWHRLRHACGDWDFALGLGGLFAVVASALHACVDFQLYMPANGLLLATLVGVTATVLSCESPARARREQHTESHQPSPVPAADGQPTRGDARLRLTWTLILVSATAACAWASRDGLTAARLEFLRGTLDLGLTEARPADVSVAQLESVIETWSKVVTDQADALNTLGSIEQSIYRLQTWQLLRAELGPHANEEYLWEVTAPAVLHRRLHDPALTQQGTLFPQPELLASLRRAERYFQRALVACPLSPSTFLSIATLSPVLADREVEVRSLQRAVRVGPFKSATKVQAGRLAYDAGMHDLAWRWWNNVLGDSDESTLEILRTIANPDLTVADLVELFHGLPERAVEAAFAVQHDRRLADLRMMLAETAERTLPAGQLAPATEAFLGGAIARFQNRNADAIRHWKEAVRLRPTQTRWRAELVDVLLQEQAYSEAYEHAQLCVAQNSRSYRYRQQLQASQDGLRAALGR